MSISRISAWSMWFVASIFYAYQSILRVMPNIMMADIMQQYGVDATAFGQFSGVYYIGYSLMHIPLGIMLDHYGPKRMIPACMVMTSVGLLPILFTNLWMYPVIGRVLIGMGSSAAILGTFKVIRFAFREDQFTRMLSFSVIIGLVGAIYGGAPVNYMCTIMGYRDVVGIFAVAGVVLAIITYAIIPTIITPEVNAASLVSRIKEVLLSGKVITVCILSGLLVGPMEGFADVWATVFLRQVYGFGETIAVSLPSAIYFGMGFGGTLLSLIAEKTRSYLVTIAIAGFIMMASFIALVSGTMSLQVMGVVFVIVGICCGYQIIAIYKASTYVKAEVIGLTTAVANMIIMFFGYLFHTTIGFTVDTMGGIGSTQALIYGISVIPIALAIGSIGFIAVALHDRIIRRKLM